MKLTAKLTAVLFLGLALVLGVHAYFKVRHETALFEEDMKRDHSKLGTTLALAIEKTRHIHSADEVIELIDEINPEKPRTTIRWVWFDASPDDPHYPAAGNHTLRSLLGHETLSLKTSQADGSLCLSTYVPVRFAKSQRQGGIEITESLSGASVYIRAAVTRIAITTGIILVVFGVLASTLGALFVGRPVQLLIEKARRVGEGDLRFPLRLKHKDEFAELANELNRMSDRLAEATELAETETSRRIAALEQLRHADRLMTVGKLAAGVAHEIGTPLSVVMARAKMIASGEVSGSEAAANAATVFEQSKRMADIIRQLLDFARPRAPEKAAVDLAELARRTIALLRPISEKKGVRLALAADSADLAAEVDSEQLQQVLSNVVINGIQAMPDGGTVTIAVSEADGAESRRDANGSGFIRVSVTDEGIGIAEEHKPHLFEPFFSTKEVGEGTGLGLSVSCGIVREHGGWMDVQSTLGEGTCVSIMLPRRAAG